MQLCIIFYFSNCFRDFTKARLKQSSIFGVHSLTAFIFMQSLNSLGQCCLTTKQPIVKNICVALYWMRKFSKRKLKHPCLSGRLWRPWLSQTNDRGSQICRLRLLIPAPVCVGIIRKLVFPSKFPIIQGTSPVCVTLYIFIILKNWLPGKQIGWLVVNHLNIQIRLTRLSVSFSEAKTATR